MLIIQMKERETIHALTEGRTLFLVLCRGCSEIAFPEGPAREVREALLASGRTTGILELDMLCSPENSALRLGSCEEQIEKAEAIAVLSCGVGVQTLSSLCEEKPVFALCDSIALPGCQGVTPAADDCERCGQCLLNLTGGICPLTACAKGLINGPCGGASLGRCEVDPAALCAWERIYERLLKLDRTSLMGEGIVLRDYSLEWKKD